MKNVMVCGPFSALMSRRGDGFYDFAGKERQRIDEVHNLLAAAGHKVVSAHSADGYGGRAWDENFVQRDLDWAGSCDVQLVLLPASRAGDTIRTDGTMIEVGFAHARNRPIIFLADDLPNAANSFFLRDFGSRHVTRCIRWEAGYEAELLNCLDGIPASASAQAADAGRRQMSNVDQVLAELRHERAPHKVRVAGLDLTVLPDVLSPRLSHAPDALISKWHIPAGSRVLDLGCGSGVLGLAALKAGAGRLVALDINRQAVKTTALNLAELGLRDWGDVRESDCYSALEPGESFEVILLAAPYWDREAMDDLDRSCFDGGHRFLQRAIEQAPDWLAPEGAMYVIFSDQGDVSQVLRMIDSSLLHIQEMHIFRPTQPGGHVRIVWELRRRSGH